MQPFARFVVVSAHERVETSVQAQEKQRELAFLRVRIETAAVLQSRDRRFARADDHGEMAIAKSETRRRRENGLGEDRSGLGGPAGEGAKGRCHHVQLYG